MSLQMAPNSAIKSAGRAGLAGGAVTQVRASRGRQARLASVSLTAPAPAPGSPGPFCLDLITTATPGHLREEGQACLLASLSTFFVLYQLGLLSVVLT